MIIKSIRVLSLAKVMAVIYAGIGLIAGLIFSFFALLGTAFGTAFQDANGPEAIFGVLFGVGAVIVLPILYGLMGFLGGLLTSAIYNVAARLMGGLELEVE